MITIKFFASLRENLKTDEVSLEFHPDLNCVDALLQHMVDENGAVWNEALVSNKLLVAVNQVLADLTSPVKDGDEVAFFPPVTGG